MVKTDNLLTLVHMLVFSTSTAAPLVSTSATLVVRAAAAVCIAVIYPLALVKSLDNARSLTFVFRSFIWPTCTAAPKAPAVPITRLRNDCNVRYI